MISWVLDSGLSCFFFQRALSRYTLSGVDGPRLYKTDIDTNYVDDIMHIPRMSRVKSILTIYIGLFQKHVAVVVSLSFSAPLLKNPEFKVVNSSSQKASLVSELTLILSHNVSFMDQIRITQLINKENSMRKRL